MGLFNSFFSMRVLFTALAFSMLCNIAHSQDKTINIVDGKTGAVITDLHYQYNKTIGISNKRGQITIAFIPNKTLYLSHIKYGKVQISSTEIEKALQDGVLKLQESANHLLPITFVQLRHGAANNNQVELSQQNRLAHDAGSLVEMIPGISSIRKSGAYGFDPVLRGFKYEQLNLVLDGCQTASAACPNRMDPAASQMPLNMVSDIEVLKGPHSLRYGNAFGGTLNFKSSNPVFKSKITPLGRLSTSYESNGSILRTEAVAGVAGEKIDVKLFGAYSKGKDYKDGTRADIAANFNRLNWGGKLGVKLTKTQTLGVLVSNNQAKDVDFPALPMDLRSDNTWLVNANHTANFYGKTLSLWSTNFYGTKVNHLMDNFGKMLNPRKVNAETKAETANYGGRSELRFDFEKSYLYGGMDYRFESADGHRTRKMLMGPMKGKTMTDNVWQDAEIRRTGVFGEYHLTSSGFHFVLSGRLDYTRSKANSPAKRFVAIYKRMDASDIHPSFSVGGTKLLGKSTSLGLWLGHATRSAGISERYINQFPIGLDPYEMLGNPNLKPEVNNQLDLVFKYQTEKSGVNVNLFASALRNYISSKIIPEAKTAMPMSPGVRKFINIDKAFMTGFEAIWTYRFARVLSQDVSLTYTYGENQFLDEPLSEIAPLELRYRLMGSFLNDKLQPELLWRNVSKQDRVSKSYGEKETPGFNVLDAKISWLASRAVTLTGGVQNLLDEAYYEHLSRSVRGMKARPIYSPGLSFYLTLTVNFL